ncbi:MAG: hypothetical protein WC736_10525 [Gallionella sp.]
MKFSLLKVSMPAFPLPNPLPQGEGATAALRAFHYLESHHA